LVAIIEIIPAAPRFLTFTNVAAGNTIDGWKYVNDSDYDWGQGLLDLKKWMDRNNVARIELGYAGRVDPAVYAIHYTLAGGPVREQYVAYSVTFLAGMTRRMPGPDGPTTPFKLNYNRALIARRPVAIVGEVIYIYDAADVLAAQRATAAQGTARD